jgi:hypothetical protein
MSATLDGAATMTVAEARRQLSDVRALSSEQLNIAQGN